MTWNCDRRFREKAPSVAAYRPDVLAVQELTRLDTRSPMAGDLQPSFRDHDELTTQWQRGLGLFSFTDLEIEPVDGADHSPSFRRYRARHGELEFQLVGLWTWPVEERKNHYKQAILGAFHYRDWLGAAPTVVLGDFNDNASYRTTNWPELLEAFTPVGLVSAYHTWTGEAFGHETNPTYFHHRALTSPWHVDYCFIPEAWAPHLTSVQVGSHERWGKLSDHMPLIVDVDPPSLGTGGTRRAIEVGSQARREFVNVVEPFSIELIDTLAEEWKQLSEDLSATEQARVLDLVDTWLSDFNSIKRKYSDLVSSGQWLRGPSDLFSVLGLARSELYHSAMIAWLLDPFGRHGLGDSVLRKLLELTFPEELEQPFHVLAVDRELARGDTRADIVVWANTFTLVIENKVDAGEGIGQCDRLYTRFSEETRPLFIFLSPSGRPPMTATGDTAQFFRPISYKDFHRLITETLEETSAAGRKGQLELVENYRLTLAGLF